MPQILTLHLVNDLGSDSIGGSQSDVPSLWPGTAVPYDFTTPPQAIRPVWVGVSADGSTNQVYPITATVAAIIGAGWPRVYQGTEIVGPNGDVLVFSEQYLHVLNALAACCARSIATAAYALLTSNLRLNVDDPLPACDAEAIFKWLAIRSPDETRTLTYSFGYTITSQDTLLSDTVALVTDAAFTETIQLVKAWADDFPDAATYAFGTLQITVVIKEAGTPVEQDTHTYRLPGVNCDGADSSASSGESSSGSASASGSGSSEIPFSPLDLPGLRVWYDVTDEDSIVTAGDLLVSMADKSGNGNHTVPVDAQRPTLITNSLTGKASLLFSNNMLPLTTELANASFTAFLVAKQSNPSALQMLMAGSSVGDWIQSYSCHNDTGTINFSLDDSLKELVGFTVRVEDTVRAELQYNNRRYSDPALVGNIGVQHIGSLGSSVPHGPSFDLAGEIAGFLYYDRRLTDAETLQVSQYLVDNFNLSPVKPSYKITGFGDSITAGVGASDIDHCYLNRIAAGLPVGAISNSGKSSTWFQFIGGVPDAATGFGRYPQDLIQCDASDRLYILYGFNDIPHVDEDVALFQAELNTMVVDLLSKGYGAGQIYLGTPGYRLGNAQAAKTIAYGDAVKAVGLANGTHVADIYQAMLTGGGDTLISGDNVHPNDAGHQLIADTFLAS